MTPTSEQQAALEAFATGEDVVITAGAGTGKTSTLRMLAATRPKARGLYLAFNKAIATEASASFPRSVQARTAHSLAYGWARRDDVGVGVLDRLNRPRRSPDEVVEFLGLDPLRVETVAGETTFPARAVYRWVSEILTAFQQSADARIDPARHLPHVPGVTRGVLEQIGQYLHEAAARAWVEMLDPAGGILPVSHATYLKLWSLSEPVLPADFVLFDEAQDASPVIAAVVCAQRTHQRVMVGDPAQAIYRFTGAVDAMSSFDAPHRLSLSRSWRFGERAATAANAYLGLLGQDLRLSGNPDVDTAVTSQCYRPDAVLCRGNAVAIAEAMSAQEAGEPTHIVGGVTEPRRFVDAAEQLQATGHCTHPELAYFPSWESVREHVEDGTDVGLRTLVRLVDEFGTTTLRQVLDACTHSEDDAHVLISTVHKAKGREWDSVDLSVDLDPNTAIELLSSEDPDEHAQARDELHIGYVAVTRARTELGAGAIAASLTPHGFPTPTSIGQGCGSEPATIIGGSQDRQWVSIPIRSDHWQALLNAYGHADPAAAAAGLILEQTLGNMLASPARQQPTAPSPVASPTDYSTVADDTLGADAADAVRALLDEARATVREATGGPHASRAGYTDQALMDLLADAISATGLRVHRARTGVGYSVSLVTDDGQQVRLSGSNFGPGYSGPALIRALRGR